MKRMLVVGLVALSGCALTPEMAQDRTTENLCQYIYQGSRQEVYTAGLELDKRGVTPEQCAGIFAAQQQRGMALIGLGTGAVIASQPARATFCQPVAGGITCY